MSTMGNDSAGKVLLHLDGTNGSTTITDSNVGGSAHTWTNHTGSISTAQSKFGGASYDATAGGYVDTPDSADFTLGGGDFTIDLWFYRSGGDGTRRFIAAQSDSAGGNRPFDLRLTTGNVVEGRVNNGLTAVTGTTTITATGWHHVAFVRTGNTLKLFVDGTQEGGDVSFSGTLADSSSNLAVGRAGEFTTDPWNGYLDEFRLSVGTARWTANFTPPGSAYVDERAAVGSFVLTGVAASLRTTLPTAAAGYARTGHAAVLVGKPTAVACAFTETGRAGLFSFNVVSATVSCALTTNVAALTPTVIVGAVTYSLSGITASFTDTLVATTQSCTVVWQTFSDVETIAASAGAFMFTGGAADLSYDIDLGGIGSNISGGMFPPVRWLELTELDRAGCAAAERARAGIEDEARAAAQQRAAGERAAIAAARATEDQANAARMDQRGMVDAMAAAAGAQRIEQTMRSTEVMGEAAQAAQRRAQAEQEDEEAVVHLLLFS